MTQTAKKTVASTSQKVRGAVAELPTTVRESARPDHMPRVRLCVSPEISR